MPEPWRAAVDATPRELFIPDRALWLRSDHTTVPIDRSTDPDTWLRAVYSNDAVITQLDDGAAAGDGDFTSSCSMPSLVLTMLDELDVKPGMTALEIGTGTGYSGALLGHRIGPQNVITIEVDPQIADSARVNLAKVDSPITVITGDGAAGYPPGSPFDRVIATASVETVPYSWVEQTRPGGLMIVPWGPPMANHHLMRFVVGDDSAVGTIIESANFMRLRSQRWEPPDEPDDFDEIADTSTTDLDPRVVLGNHARLAVALHLGECRAVFETDASGETLWLLAADSWASVSGGAVRQAGARRLWDEAEAAYSWWLEQGSPVRPRFHITVTAERQWVWLDSPENEVAINRSQNS
ncbi:methyltransferase domain-containing protein [Amycolatopsis anabasis]|uniref:methyltransferase domain-containing protein n=1 Tax=Amycolatopsis anabasis TaxID=1840409 RepID=UPI00131D4B0B|nr:methyltransferase domain-containing protein [Amycolatopsis anabasis]